MLFRKYLSEREEAWRRFESLLAKAEKHRIKSLSDEELQEFGVLYRRVTVHLAQLRTRTEEKRLIAYLNGLVARGHAQIYVTRPNYSFRRIGRLFLRDFPRVFSETWPFQVVAVCLLLLSLSLSFVATRAHPENGYAFLSVCDVRAPGSNPEDLRDLLHQGRESSSGYRTFFSSFLFSNNTRIGILAFASGVFFCIPTLILITYNGLMLGAMSAVYHNADLATAWWAWILPHGVTELLAISIVSAGGLLLGFSLIDPKGLPRIQALARRGKQAAVLVVGAIPMFLVAALLEGFLRQSELSAAPRLAFAAFTFVFWIAFFGIGSRRAGRRIRADYDPGSPGISRSTER